MSSSTCFVFGSRSLRNSGLVARVLGKIASDCDEFWSGGARGADRIAICWARVQGFPVREYLAKWTNPDGSKNMAAGFQRTDRLIADLPAGSRAIAFASAPRPSNDEAREAGGIREFLSKGTRYSCGACLAKGINLAIVWACGSITFHAGPGSGPKPRGWYDGTVADKLDMRPQQDHCLGEVGFDLTANHVVINNEILDRNRHELDMLADNRTPTAAQAGADQREYIAFLTGKAEGAVQDARDAVADVTASIALDTFALDPTIDIDIEKTKAIIEKAMTAIDEVNATEHLAQQAISAGIIDKEEVIDHAEQVAEALHTLLIEGIIVEETPSDFPEAVAHDYRDYQSDLAAQDQAEYEADIADNQPKPRKIRKVAKSRNKRGQNEAMKHQRNEDRRIYSALGDEERRSHQFGECKKRMQRDGHRHGCRMCGEQVINASICDTCWEVCGAVNDGLATI